jgi:hypothetical protein
MPSDDTTIAEHQAEDRAAQADFDAGAAMETGAKATPAAAPDTPELKAAPAPAAAEIVAKPPEPKYIRITEDQFATLNAAAAKTATFEAQLSKAFGTIGNMQKVVNGLQGATPRGLKVEIPKDAFAGMAKDFPELAEHTRAGLEATLRGITGTAPATADIDPDLMQQLVNKHVVQLETEALEDAFPDWRSIVGAVDVSKQEKPDPNNPFRKWLGAKPAAYQAKVNGTHSAAVLSRAIQAFQADTKAPNATPPAASLRDQMRTARIQAAVKPRGDGGQAPPSRTDDDDFEAGFASR